MQLEMIKVIKPFLEFLRYFDVGHVHNMVAIILDPCLKALCIVENLVDVGMWFSLQNKFWEL